MSVGAGGTRRDDMPVNVDSRRHSPRRCAAGTGPAGAGAADSPRAVGWKGVHEIHFSQVPARRARRRSGDSHARRRAGDSTAGGRDAGRHERVVVLGPAGRHRRPPRPGRVGPGRHRAPGAHGPPGPPRRRTSSSPAWPARGPPRSRTTSSATPSRRRSARPRPRRSPPTRPSPRSWPTRPSSVAPTAGAGATAAAGAPAVGTDSTPKAARPRVPGAPRVAAPPQAGAAAAAPSTPAVPAAPAAVNPAACSTNPAKPMLEPEALQTMNVRSDNPKAKTARPSGSTARGVKVAYIADGINPNNTGFTAHERQARRSSTTRTSTATGPNAPTGGAEAFGDASGDRRAGQRRLRRRQVRQPEGRLLPGRPLLHPHRGCRARREPRRAQGRRELLPNSAILQAIDYAVTRRPRQRPQRVVRRQHLPGHRRAQHHPAVQRPGGRGRRHGHRARPATPASRARSAASATDPHVISAGASTDSRIYEQTGYALRPRSATASGRTTTSRSLSSAGITSAAARSTCRRPARPTGRCAATTSTEFAGVHLVQRRRLADIQSFGGTSQSAPFTAGVAALVIQAYRKHARRHLADARRWSSSSSPAPPRPGPPGDEQGSGRVDARAAVEAALTYPGAKKAAPKGTASNVARRPTSSPSPASPGSTVTGSVTVTNVGTATQTVSLGRRNYAISAARPGRRSPSTRTRPPDAVPDHGGRPWVVQDGQVHRARVPTGWRRPSPSSRRSSPTGPAGRPAQPLRP